MQPLDSKKTNSLRNPYVLKILALLSHVRWQNIFILALSQYLAVFFVLNDPDSWREVIRDWVMHIIIICGILTVSGGYLINNFYDREKDLINRPNRTLFEAYVNNDLLVRLYILLNFIALGLSLVVSLRAFLYYFVFVVLLWFYSHKAKKKSIAGNLMASSLAVYPFFSVFIYYNLHNGFVLLYTLLIWSLLYVRELVKDLESHRGDLIAGYRTLPVLLGKLNAFVFLRWIMVADAIVFFAFAIMLYGKLQSVFIYSIAVSMVLFGMYALSFRSKVSTYITFCHHVFKVLIVAGILFLAIESDWQLVD